MGTDLLLYNVSLVKSTSKQQTVIQTMLFLSERQSLSFSTTREHYVAHNKFREEVYISLKVIKSFGLEREGFGLV